MKLELRWKCPHCGREGMGAPRARCTSCEGDAQLVLLCDVCGQRLEGTEFRRCGYCERSVGDGGLTD